MAGKTSKSAWTGFERYIATAWSLIFKQRTTRTPLSGINSGHGPGDIIIPKELGLDLVVEAKYRAKNAQHSLYDGAFVDAVRHGRKGDCALLYTKVKGALNSETLVTMRASKFHEVMLVPGTLECFKSGERRGS